MKPDRVVRTNRKTIALIIDTDGYLIVRAPKQISDKEIDRIVKERESWINAKQREVKHRQTRIQPKLFAAGEEYLFLGESYQLKLVGKQEKPLSFDRKYFSLLARERENGAQAFENWYRRQARYIFSERIIVYADLTGLQYKSIRITGAKTRWGSCGAKGTLNFTWRLIMAPLDIIDYVVLHEVSHLAVKDHSQNFWSLIEMFMPDFRARRKWLKANGHKLII